MSQSISVTREDDSFRHSFWHDGRVVTVSLTGLALIIFALGFRSAAFPWLDAIGAATAHVVPGAIAGLIAWQLQHRLQGTGSFLAPILHAGFALAIGIFLVIMRLPFTYVATPDVFGHHVVHYAPIGTAATGVVLYAAVAFIYALQAARQRVAESQAALARAELSALRARVEPHFLYNTLETISGLVRHDPAAAESAIGRLGRMLRRVLQEPDDGAADTLIPLSQELLLVHDYCEIEKLRLGERLTIIEKIDEEARDLGVPSFSVQTLVENAVTHGLSDKPEGGTVSLTAERQGETLILVVADDGVGAQKETLERGGFGLGLLRKRLETHYAGRATFDVTAAQGHGVSVRISVPATELE